jgi:tungstate transport system substrate-binding protein
MKRKWIGRLLIGLVLLMLITACRESATRPLVLATTTSTYDSGLLDAILPDFESAHNAEVEVIAVGTGQALALGEAGDVDVILFHAREREDAFVAEGYGVNRQDVMANDFVIVGPAVDPAGIAGLEDVTAALQQIAGSQSTFVSRGDDSGTHIRELALWAVTGIAPAGDWYLSVGQGMGGTLTVADQEQAYTLSDRGTFLARRAQGIDLVVLVEGDERLVNPYGVIAVNPERHPAVNAELANDFINWLTSPSTQAAINNFTASGEQLFFAPGGAYASDPPE